MRKFVIVLLCLVVIMQLADCVENDKPITIPIPTDVKKGGKPDDVGKPDGVGSKGGQPNTGPQLSKRSVDSQLDGNPTDNSFAPPDQNARV